MVALPEWMLASLRAALGRAPDFTVTLVATLVGVFVAFELERRRQQGRDRESERLRRQEAARFLHTLMWEVNANLHLARQAKETVGVHSAFIPVRMRFGLWIANRERALGLLEDAQEVADFSRFFEASEHLDQVLRFLEESPPPHAIRIDPPTHARKSPNAVEVVKEIGRLVEEIMTYGSELSLRHPDLADRRIFPEAVDQ